MARPRSSRPPQGWRGNRDLSLEGKAFTATHPSLYMHVWCNFSGVHLVAYVDHLDAKGRLVRVEVGKASWKPPTVTEELIVQWGQRCLTRWLEQQAGADQDAG